MCLSVQVCSAFAANYSGEVSDRGAFWARRDLRQLPALMFGSLGDELDLKSRIER